MPLPNEYAQVRLVVADPGGIESEIVGWYVPSGSPTPPLDLTYANSFAAALAGALAGPMKGVLTGPSLYVGCFVRMNFSGVVYTAISRAGAGGGAAGAVDFLPQQNAAIIGKFSNVPGRPGLGRWFIPLVPESFTSGPKVNALGLAAYTGLANALAGNLAVGPDTWNPAHRSRKNDTLLPIVSTVAKEDIKSQDRRSLQLLL